MRSTLRIPILLTALAAASLAQPNPYHEVEHWAALPAGMQWGQVISVDPLPGGNILAFQRAEPPLLVFDRSGKLVKSFGDGMFIQPHGLTVDKQGFIWATDAAARNGKGEQVFKFSPDGKVLMTLGTAGVAGESETAFNGPTDVAIAPNGDIFVSDGHVNNRVMKFSKDGKFIKAWGKKGSGPGEFNVPHTLAFDSRGRLFVGDRSNSRIQIFDQDGNYLDEWKQFSRPSGIFITPDDIILVADSDSNTATNPGWKRGIRIGSVKTGKVTALIPEIGVDPDSKERWYPGGPQISVTSGPEGVAMDSQGNVYGAEVGPRALKKYAK
ncbi:MAG TPA: peptidyl-alpha-hydroxyglycine alpha-amidating lyase family protein [Bryobacteraceae bacterium]|nr:peptidyl-alpha-hydroxyglycine alpha-amidating lyase family protein [Bryobacteraceae bacterium]